MTTKEREKRNAESACLVVGTVCLMGSVAILLWINPWILAAAVLYLVGKALLEDL